MNRYLSGVLLCLAATTAHAAEPLTVCMSEDNAPLSYRTKGPVVGFDVLLARAIASDLGRELRVVPTWLGRWVVCWCWARRFTGPARS